MKFCRIRSKSSDIPKTLAIKWATIESNFTSLASDLNLNMQALQGRGIPVCWSDAQSYAAGKSFYLQFFYMQLHFDEPEGFHRLTWGQWKKWTLTGRCWPTFDQATSRMRSSSHSEIFTEWDQLFLFKKIFWVLPPQAGWFRKAEKEHSERRRRGEGELPPMLLLNSSKQL